MYEAFYGLKEKPFTLLPDPDYLYLSPKHQRALTLLEYGMMNHAGFSVICGDTGAGKTTLIRRLLSELGDDTTVGLITNTHQSFGELLNWVLMAYGLDGDGKSKAQMHQIFVNFLIEQYADQKHTVLIVDEAQNMKADTLEELRMLSNINADKDQVLQVILAGQPALRETLRKPELMQFAQRIAVDYYLEALSEEETQAYIAHRLGVAGAKEEVFTKDACQAIFQYSGGTPRLINLLCDTALVYGFAEQVKQVSARLVHDVVEEQHSSSIIPTFNTGADVLTQFDAVENHAEGEAKDAENEQEVEDAIARLAERAVQAVNKAEQAVMVKQKAAVNAINQSRPVIREVEVNRTVTDAVEDVEAEQISKVTPIAAKNSANEEVVENTLEDTPNENESENGMEHNSMEGGEEQEGGHNEARSSDKTQRSIHGFAPEDVYPIVHVEENPKKTFSLLLTGLVGGMFVASIIMVVIAYMLFSSSDLKLESRNVSVSESSSQAEKRELEIIQKERDAALAVSRALEKERDAALAAAKAQEEMRAAEMRAAEILAEQERAADARLREARARARAAEIAEQKAIERERLLRVRAEERAAELRLQQEQAALIEKARLEELKRQTAISLTESNSVVQENEKEIAALSSKVAVTEESKEITESDYSVVKSVDEKNIKEIADKKFTANPCNSASAKFLSTCKK